MSKDGAALRVPWFCTAFPRLEERTSDLLGGGKGGSALAGVWFKTTVCTPKGLICLGKNYNLQ